MRAFLRRTRIGTLAAAVVGVATACSGPEAGGPPQSVPSVEAVPARYGALPLEERLNGVVRAENQVAIHSEINASIAEVMVRSGAAVAKGQALVRLQDDALQDQLRQAEASLRLARAEAAEAKARLGELEGQTRRSRVLAKEQLLSELDLETLEAQLAAAKAGADQADARVDNAEATLQERRTALDKTVVRAPVSGTVGRRNAEVGMLVDRGTVLFILGKLDRVIVEVPLTEAMLRYVKTGQTVRLSGPSLDRTLQASVSRISPFLAESSFSTVGEIDVDNPDGVLRPGMYVAVDVLYGESEQATLVPSSALWDDPRTGRQGVFVVDGSGSPVASIDTAGDEGPMEREVAFRPVEVIAEGRGTAGLRGVEEGEWVVTVGQHLLPTDAPVGAHIHPTEWSRVLELQGLQRENVLREFLDKQQRMARSDGAEPPTNEERRREVTGHGAEPAADATADGGGPTS